MKWASVMEEGANLSERIERGASRLRDALGTAQPDLVLCFCTTPFRPEIEYLPGLLQERCPARVHLGCLAAGVIGEGREVEDRPAVSLVGAVLPGVSIQPVHLVTDDLPDEDSPPEVWRRRIGLEGGASPMHFVLLVEPFTSLVEPLLAGLDYAYPGGTVTGGFASAGRRPGENAMWLGSSLYREGVAGVALSGALAVTPLVAQGCRPIGEPKVVTRCRGTTLLALGEEPPLHYLNRLYREAEAGEQARMKDSLVIGVQLADELGTEPRRAPFLIRNLIQAHYGNGSVDVGAYLREGQVVQFHLRDRAAAEEDLQQQLAASASDPCGSLLFSCLGRGGRLFGQPDHDSRQFMERHPGIAPGGFFCGGEIGPVAGQSFVHGFTSVFAQVERPAGP